MDYERMTYSLIGSLIAGSVIQKNMGLELWGFFVISIGLWAVCTGIQWWNYKIQQKLRDQAENLTLESRDAIVKKVLEVISEGNAKKISKLDELMVCYKSTSSNLQETLEQFDEKIGEITYINQKILDKVGTVSETEALLNRVIELENAGLENIKSIEATSIHNKDCICGDISAMKELVDRNYKDATAGLKEAAGKTTKDICSHLIEQSSHIQDTITIDIKGEMAKTHKDLCGILANLQSALEDAGSKISDIQSTDENMYGLLEDAKNKLDDVEGAIGEGTGKIEDAVSQNMERQNEIVTEEQHILDSYNKLLGRINDEVIAKLISDSNSLLKCMQDCYNLLDSQRRVKK